MFFLMKMSTQHKVGEVLHQKECFRLASKTHKQHQLEQALLWASGNHRWAETYDALVSFLSSLCINVVSLIFPTGHSWQYVQTHQTFRCSWSDAYLQRCGGTFKAVSRSRGGEEAPTIRAAAPRGAQKGLTPPQWNLIVMMWMEFLLGPYFGQFQWHSQPETGSFWLKFCHGTYIVIEKPEYT